MKLTEKQIKRIKNKSFYNAEMTVTELVERVQESKITFRAHFEAVVFDNPDDLKKKVKSVKWMNHE